MKKIFIRSTLVYILFSTIVPTFFLTVLAGFNLPEKTDFDEEIKVTESEEFHEITGKIRKGETLFDIFKHYELNLNDLFSLKEASASIYKLRYLRVNQPYRIRLDENKQINSFTYWIDEDTILNITCGEEGFCAEKIPVPYEKKIEHIGGVIQDNLISALGHGKESLVLAQNLSDIFAWDIDFTTDIRKGDTFRLVAEGFYLNGTLKKYGNILSAEVINNGKAYRAYRFTDEEGTDYYDASGKSLKKTFLRAPLNFRRISSTFSNGRYHPILKITRPHHGVDYAAPEGTPVSAAGDGSVVFAGRRGQYGNLVILKHPGGYQTYYGHLSKIHERLRQGTEVSQGSLIGLVGSTGLATGPHLHFEMRINDRPINPLSISVPRGSDITVKSTVKFERLKAEQDVELASIPPGNFLAIEGKRHGNPGSSEG
ncbi:MAG: Murein DD-endopeptidase MepM [Syntrophus sp. PtaU1.Bin005]|jgi:murein DD-endopeptidase MepM/ murein hydrolase activator NlpD|uniref:M23 family metallopeptidase n=1 Tax=Syntrophus TaxID=43773 RepID=UPI0009D0F3A7|nr:MAG: Murein DD-endopeptidase MepM [Syntrophus sp. PtaB.Bin138]OPY78852.1 MAG: Murein DD-endopeptidase MepM [Syntrophus sp. PtaU1.Bin005]